MISEAWKKGHAAALEWCEAGCPGDKPENDCIGEGSEADIEDWEQGFQQGMDDWMGLEEL